MLASQLVPGPRYMVDRATSASAVAANPKCTVNVDVHNRCTPPKVAVTFGDWPFHPSVYPSVHAYGIATEAESGAADDAVDAEFEEVKDQKEGNQ